MKIEGGAAEFSHLDHQGSAAAITDAAGVLVCRELYTPYGEKTVDHACGEDEPGYTGHVQDTLSGLTYMQARYYDPVAGRFLSTDPVGYQDQFNLYAYVANDPVNMIDPTGKESCPRGKQCEDIQKPTAEEEQAAADALRDASIRSGADEEGAVGINDSAGKLDRVLTGDDAGEGSEGDFQFMYSIYSDEETAFLAHSHPKSDASGIMAGSRKENDRNNEFPSPQDLSAMNQTGAPLIIKTPTGALVGVYREGNIDHIYPIEGSMDGKSIPHDIRWDTVIDP